VRNWLVLTEHSHGCSLIFFTAYWRWQYRHMQADRSIAIADGIGGLVHDVPAVLTRAKFTNGTRQQHHVIIDAVIGIIVWKCGKLDNTDC